MKKTAVRLCRWGCGRRLATRICGICVFCIDARDAGPWIPPEKRPNHRFFKRKQLSPAQLAAIERRKAAKASRIPSR